MKFKFLILFFFLISCANYSTNIENRSAFNSKGFAYIFSEKDFDEKILKKKLDNTKLQIAHSSLRPNTLIKIINPKTKDYLTIKNLKNVDYPDFYKILITEKVAKSLNLNLELPLVEILEIKKNKSFVAKKAKIFNEEKKIPSNAPVTSVKISNISKNKDTKKRIDKDDFIILIATFYSNSTAEFLKERITKEIPNFDQKKLKIVKQSNKEINLISGPYNTINLMKNDYILLKGFGFEELDIINE